MPLSTGHDMSVGSEYRPWILHLQALQFKMLIRAQLFYREPDPWKTCLCGTSSFVLKFTYIIIDYGYLLYVVVYTNFKQVKWIQAIENCTC